MERPETGNLTCYRCWATIEPGAIRVVDAGKVYCQTCTYEIMIEAQRKAVKDRG